MSLRRSWPITALSMEVRAKQPIATDRDTLDTSTTGKTANGRLGDTLDVVSKDLAMALGTTLAESFATFTTYLSSQYVMDRENSALCRRCKN